MQMLPSEIHIWTQTLVLSPEEEKAQLAILSEDEQKRAQRFLSATHRQRFIAARSILRKIVGYYLNIMPSEVIFQYQEKGKPFLSENHQSSLQFNLAHSHDLAMYAFTLHDPVGIDVEKIASTYDAGIVKRYFTIHEQEEFNRLAESEKLSGFYRLWSRKEALVKAVGDGMMSLTKFSVSVHDKEEIIFLAPDQPCTLLPLMTLPDYQATVATLQRINKISYWQFDGKTPILRKVIEIF